MFLLKLEHKWSNYFEDVCHLGVSKNRGTPKLSILIGFGTIIFTIHFGGKIPLFLVQHPFEGFSLGILKKNWIQALDLKSYHQHKIGFEFRQVGQAQVLKKTP